MSGPGEGQAIPLGRGDWGSAQIGGERVEMDYVSRPWQAEGRLPARAADEEGFIGEDQLEHLARVLDDVPYLMADLEVATTRQDRFPARPTPSGDGSESPLPFREAPADTSRALSLAVWGVTSVLWRRATGQPVPFRDVREAAAWLRSSLVLLSRDPDAESYARRIADLHDQALTGPIERPPDWHYLGPCPECGRDLRAEAGDEVVECGCGYRATVQAVIERVLAETDDMLFTEGQLVGALELDGKIVTRYQIEGWHRRGRLEGHEQKRWAPRARKIITVRCYRLGDVRSLLADRADKLH